MKNDIEQRALSFDIHERKTHSFLCNIFIRLDTSLLLKKSLNCTSCPSRHIFHSYLFLDLCRVESEGEELDAVSCTFSNAFFS